MWISSSLIRLENLKYQVIFSFILIYKKTRSCFSKIFRSKHVVGYKPKKIQSSPLLDVFREKVQYNHYTILRSLSKFLYAIKMMTIDNSSFNTLQCIFSPWKLNINQFTFILTVKKGFLDRCLPPQPFSYSTRIRHCQMNYSPFFVL